MEMEDFIRELNAILMVEYGAVLQYILHTFRLTRSGNKEIANELMKFVNDEIRHAETLAKKIRDLGGKSTKSAQWTQTEDDLGSMLRINLASEKNSISMYEKLIKAADKKEFLGLKNLLEDQLADEVKHVKLLQKYLSEKEMK